MNTFHASKLLLLNYGWRDSLWTVIPQLQVQVKVNCQGHVSEYRVGQKFSPKASDGTKTVIGYQDQDQDWDSNFQDQNQDIWDQDRDENSNPKTKTKTKTVKILSWDRDLSMINNAFFFLRPISVDFQKAGISNFANEEHYGTITGSPKRRHWVRLLSSLGLLLYRQRGLIRCNMRRWNFYTMVCYSQRD